MAVKTSRSHRRDLYDLPKINGEKLTNNSAQEKCITHAPGGGSGGVAEAVEGVLGGLALRRCQAQLLLHLVNDGAATRVQQEVLKRIVELGHIRLVHHHLHLHQQMPYNLSLSKPVPHPHASPLQYVQPSAAPSMHGCPSFVTWETQCIYQQVICSTLYKKKID